MLFILSKIFVEKMKENYWQAQKISTILLLFGKYTKYCLVSEYYLAGNREQRLIRMGQKGK
jgi:hypothetical protein